MNAINTIDTINQIPKKDNLVDKKNESNDNSRQNLHRPSVFNESKDKKYRNCYKSKWANLKFFLQDKASLESSINILKNKTIEQFSTKCKDIYKKKIEINTYAKDNSRLIPNKHFFSGYEDISSKIQVFDGICGLPTDSIQTFFFIFRENNHLMLKLIENIDNNKIDNLATFLCHFFYENFYMESTEQAEIIYIIYLLLEKEIAQLITPSENSFLNESFISRFLDEIANRNEIKNYIDIILNDLICNLEETHSKYKSWDITVLPIQAKIEDIYDLTDQGELKPVVNVITNFSSPNSEIKIEFLINLLHKNIRICYTERDFLEYLNKEKNEAIRQFFIEQFKKIKNCKYQKLFDPYQLHEYLKRNGKIVKDSIVLYNREVQLIIDFIDNLLNNLENNNIAPYSIKVICKFIYILTKKKFKNITKFQLNNFVARFLFDKLILPILKNQDKNDVGKNRMIPLVIRKHLLNIYIVLQNLVKGELFNTNQNINFVAFNKYIIDNYYRINSIIEKMLDVKIPEKLKKLSEQFYIDEDFILDNSKRKEEDINYDYFKEYPNDFMEHKSICFTTNDLKIFYKVVSENKNLFIEPGKPLEETFETLSNFMPMIIDKPNTFYVIINNNFNEEAQKLLFQKEKIVPLGKAKTDEEKIQNIYYCISHLIGNLEILPHWDWVINNYNTIDTFKFINEYLNLFEENNIVGPGEIPLNWYSLYIINNLSDIKPEDAINDYQSLYDNIESQIRAQLEKLTRLNEFLTANMTTKFLLIDNKIKIFEEELENVKNTFVNIKTLLFMESQEILVSLATVGEYKEKNIPIEGIDQNLSGKNYNLILKKETYVPSKIDKNMKKKEKEEIIPKNYCFFLKTIPQFIEKLVSYRKLIYEELIKIENRNNSRSIISQKDNKKTKVKSIIDEYINFIDKALEKSRIFYPSRKTINDDDLSFRNTINEKDSADDKNNDQKPKNIPSEFKEIAKHSIKNYIIKTLGIYLYKESLKNKNEGLRFYQKCISLSWIKPENLAIRNDICDEDIFADIIEHIKKMDNLRNPEEMLNELELATQIINSLFIFMQNKTDSDADSFIVILIYSIIMAKPKRFDFNLKFIEYFLDEKYKMGKLKYYLTQALTAVEYIMGFTGKELNVSEQEFNKKCSEAMKEFGQKK